MVCNKVFKRFFFPLKESAYSITFQVDKRVMVRFFVKSTELKFVQHAGLEDFDQDFIFSV